MFRGIRKTLVFVFCLQQSVFVKESLSVHIKNDGDNYKGILQLVIEKKEPNSSVDIMRSQQAEQESSISINHKNNISFDNTFSKKKIISPKISPLRLIKLKAGSKISIP